MAKLSRRTVSRKMKRTHKRKTAHRRNKYKGGEAPVNYHLSGSWPSRMSLGQGADYFKYHEGQHGGALGMGPYPSAVLSPGLPADLRGPAHIGGIDKAIADVRPLKDANQAGGKRKKNKNKNKTKRNKKNKTKRNKKDKRRTKRNKSKRNKRGKRKGGSLGYRSFPELVECSWIRQKAYAQAGLNPEWKTDVAFTDAKIRDTQ
jgi:hypothetical protein